MNPKKRLLTEEEAKQLSPLKAIRQGCLECMNFQTHEITMCPSTECAFHQYRFGKNPKRKGQGNITNLKK